MRRYLLIACACCTLVPAAARADLRLFACEPEWASLAQALGGEKVDVRSAISPAQDPHYIEARPSLIAQVRRADLVVCTGADLEIGWLPLLLRQSGNAAVQPGGRGYFEASEHVTLLDVPSSVDRAEGDIHPYGNPHIQLDPRNVALVADALAERLASLDPDAAQWYRDRHTDFSARWSRALERWTEAARPLAGMEIVVYHRSWTYLARWLGLVVAGTLETKPGIPPTSAHLAQLLASVEERPVAVIVQTSYDGSRATQWLARQTGLPDVVLPHTPGAVDGADDLFSMFDTILARLLDARQ